MAARRWRVGTASVVVLGVAAACRQLVGIGDEPPMAPGDAGQTTGEGGAEAGAGCGITYAGGGCEACLESQCCTQATACARGVACSALEGCLGACSGDPMCRAACVSAHRIGPDPLYAALGACLAASCAQPCGIVCGGLAEDFGADAAAGCQSCILDNNSVCLESQACATDPACRAVDGCRQTSPFLDRLTTCQDAHDAGLDAYDMLYGDLGNCQTQCAFGNQWYCAGTPLQSPQSSPPVMASLFLYDYISNGPVAGASVALCSPDDPTCATVLGTATSEASGLVTLAIPGHMGSPGPTGYLSITGVGLFPELFFWGFPLSEPRLTGMTGSLTSNEVGFLVSTLPVSVDLSTHAVVAVQAFDCEITRAPGVEFSIANPDATTRVFYLAGSSPSTTASATDPTGGAVIVNVPVPADRTVVVTATPEALGRPSTVVQGFVHPGMVTIFGAYVNQ